MGNSLSHDILAPSDYHTLQSTQKHGQIFKDVRFVQILLTNLLKSESVSNDGIRKHLERQKNILMNNTFIREC